MYNPKPRKLNCRRSCGNISVPFPFDLEEGCSGREEFQLNCTDVASSTLTFLWNQYLVSDLNIGKGVLVASVNSYMEATDRSGTFYTASVVTEDFHWAVSSLSCQQAQQDIIAYACVSANSTCLEVNYTDKVLWVYTYIGYRCKCVDGFDGNPYIPNGCQGSLSHTKTTHTYSFDWFFFHLIDRMWMQILMSVKQHQASVMDPATIP